MPAREDCYYNQRVLHIAFAVSSILMFVSIIWMIMDDHLREWKVVQREFADLEVRKTDLEIAEAQKEMESKAPGKLAALRQELTGAEAKLAEEKGKIREIEGRMVGLSGKYQSWDQKISFARADRDSIASKMDIAIGEGHETEAAEYRKQLEEIARRIDEIRPEWEKAEQELQAARKEIDAIRKSVSDREKEIGELTKEEKRLTEVRAKKQWTFASTIRGIPVLDAFAAPVQIEQTVLDQLPIDYNFKGVPRFDRCTTCHKAIDSITKDGRPAFDDALLEKAQFTSRNRNAFKTHPRPQLFVGPTSPHNRERFGCTVCHGGQGSGTTFLYASHTPNSVAQEEEWAKERAWHDLHFWESPMAPARFIESACLKCHPNVTDLENHPKYGNAAPRLVAGFNIVRQFGCFGCHEIGGFKDGKQIGPDLRLEPQSDDERAKAEKDTANPPGQMRKVGPSLRLVHEKTSAEWLALWIKHPAGFRPETRMPQFYGLSNNDGKTSGSEAEDVVRGDTEIRAMVHYLTKKSQEFRRDITQVQALDATAFQKLADRKREVEPRVTGPGAKPTDAERDELARLAAQIPLRDLPLAVTAPAIDPKNADQARRGKGLFAEKGCLACHSHSAFPVKDYPQAVADYGPDLSNAAAKLTIDGKPNVAWLFNWIRNPRQHHPRGFMPHLKLKDVEAADITAWLLSVPGDWSAKPSVAPLDEKALDELLRLFLEKSMTLSQADETILRGLPAEAAAQMRGDEALLVAPIDTDKKLMYLGRKTISRLGCFGCHDIPGFETAKPIGTPLFDWGTKALRDAEKLDFAHIDQYLEETHQRDSAANKEDYDYFAAGFQRHSGRSFLWQKLRNPRSYDYAKQKKAWDDRLRMPRFTFDVDPAKNERAIQDVMTFVLGLVGDELTPPYYRHLPTGPKLAAINGWKAINKFNCGGCHVLQMPEIVFDKTKVNLQALAAQHALEFESVREFQKRIARKDAAIAGTNWVRGQGAILGDVPPLALPHEVTEDNVASIQLWEPIQIDGKTYMVNDKLVLNEPSAVNLKESKPAIGGQFGEFLAVALSKTASKPAWDMWFRVPPPLVRQGMKVQPAWLHQFLLDPSEIRPGVVLRMPKFNLSSKEAADITAYFAYRDGVETPYEYVRERDEAYLADRLKSHATYLRDGWRLLTLVPDAKAGGAQDKLCANCHNVGGVVVKGSPEELGPNLLLTPDRLRSEWLLQWIASPGRTLPYTGMPKNFDPAARNYQPVFKGTSAEQVAGVRDALVNYHSVQQAEISRSNVPPQSSGGN